MKKTTSLLISFIVFIISCTKSTATTTTAIPTEANIEISNSYSSNPILGSWKLGLSKILGSSNDTIVSQNANGALVNFNGNDTAYYYANNNSATATARSPYTILNDSTFIMGDTMHIISFDGTNLTAYSKSSYCISQQWTTYIKN